MQAPIPRILLVVTLCALLLACQAEPTPAPPPAAPPKLTPTASAPPLPATVAPTPAPTAVPSAVKLVAVGDRLQLVLPTDWQSLEIAAPELQQSLATLAQSAAGLDPAAVKRLLAAVDPQSTALVAWLNDPAPTAAATTSLLVTVLPRDGLRLESYLATARAALGRQPGVTVAAAQVEVNLRVDGQPVGLLHYTLPVNPARAAGPAMAGWQVALFDQPAEQLVLLTFSTPSTQSSTHFPVFQEIVRTLVWN